MQRHVSAAFGSICGAYAIRPYRIRIKKDFLMGNGLFSAFLIFFSCLDARKEAKENQALCRGRGSLAWYVSGGRMLLRPYISWYTDILTIKMHPGRGVSHTPSERFRRKRRDTPRHKNNHSPPPAASGRRIQYAPTHPDTLIF